MSAKVIQGLSTSALAFSDPKTGLDRLKCLEEEIGIGLLTALRMTPSLDLLRILTDELRIRSEYYLSKNISDFDAIWHFRCYDDAMKLQALYVMPTTDISVYKPIIVLMSEISILKSLQIIIDIAQQKGFASKTSLREHRKTMQLEESVVRAKSAHSAILENLFYDLVELGKNWMGRTVRAGPKRCPSNPHQYNPNHYFHFSHPIYPDEMNKPDHQLITPAAAMGVLQNLSLKMLMKFFLDEVMKRCRKLSRLNEYDDFERMWHWRCYNDCMNCKTFHDSIDIEEDVPVMLSLPLYVFYNRTPLVDLFSMMIVIAQRKRTQMETKTELNKTPTTQYLMLEKFYSELNDLFCQLWNRGDSLKQPVSTPRVRVNIGSLPDEKPKATRKSSKTVIVDLPKSMPIPKKQERTKKTTPAKVTPIEIPVEPMSWADMDSQSQPHSYAHAPNPKLKYYLELSRNSV